MPRWDIYHYYAGIKHFYIDDVFNPPLSSYNVGDYYQIPASSYTFITSNTSAGLERLQQQLYDDCTASFNANRVWIDKADSDQGLENPSIETLGRIMRLLEKDTSKAAFGTDWLGQSSTGHLIHHQS